VGQMLGGIQEKDGVSGFIKAFIFAVLFMIIVALYLSAYVLRVENVVFMTQTKPVTVNGASGAGKYVYTEVPFVKKNSDYIAVPIGDRLVSSSSVTPITDNPKARKITYSVLGMIDPDVYFSLGSTGFKDYEGTAKSVNERIQYQLYELNNAHSKELAEFYNPLNPGQQELFKKLVNDFMNERLEGTGISVLCTGFQIE